MFFNAHNHTHYSNLRLLDCIIKPKDLIDKAIQLGLSGVAITDHESLSAHMEVNMYAKKIRETHPDFTVALGNEIYLTEDRSKNQQYYHFILIAKDALGHKALRELSSKAWMNSYEDRRMERVPTLKSELAEVMSRYKGHVMATTACMGGELPRLLIMRYETGKFNLPFDDPSAAFDKQIKTFMDFCISTFGKDDFFIECAPSENGDQIHVNQMLKEIATEYGLRMIVATDSHYLSKETRFAHKAYLNSKGGDREVDAFYEFARLMDEEEVKQLLYASFPSVRQDPSDWGNLAVEKDFIEEMLDNTEYMRKQIQWYSLERPQQIPTVEVPSRIDGFMGWSLPNNCPTLKKINERGNDQEQYWLDCCMEALRTVKIYENDRAAYIDRLEVEADVISFIGDRLGACLFSYFNTFKHYIDLFWDCGSIVGPGRGSATGFLSNYLLGITQLDPIEWHLPWWRFLNKERAELPDIDIDLAPSKRPEIFKRIRDERGPLGLVQVATFGTEGSRSAILTACRGYRYTDQDGIELFPEGIDPDIAQYISSLIPSHRGFTWPIKDVLNGNPDEDRQPVAAFSSEVQKYPGLIDIIQAIEGIVKQRGCHASGVILYDENIFDTAALMRTPSGDLITCYDLHMAEAAGDTKYDFLVTEVSDKIIKCYELFLKDKVIEEMNLREFYNKYLHPQVIDTTDPRIWEALANGSVLDVFQFNAGVGLAIAKKLHPQNPIEMTAANAMMRLMSEKGKESQQDRYYRIKTTGIESFDKEMKMKHLPEDMIQAMHNYCDPYYGCCPIQEQMMEILMDQSIAKFSLGEANAARKIVAKKKMKEIPNLREKVFNAIPDVNQADYIWEVAVAPQLGYAFSLNHSLPYSFVGIQTILLATEFNPIYWNTACLIVNSGATDPTLAGTTDYGKIAKAIGDIRSRGIQISLASINQSLFGFVPDAQTNQILFGLKGMLNIGDDLIERIILNRPYESLGDFIVKVNPNKQAMISLIKGGAFDIFDERKAIMATYLWMTCDKKKRITLQNMNGLIQRGLLPQELSDERAAYEFTRYLKNVCKGDAVSYMLDDRALNYLNKNDMNDLIEGGQPYTMKKSAWDKVYQKKMDNVRAWMKDNQDEALYQLNKTIFAEDWKKYATGNYSSWEMEALCFYYHEHELANVNKSRYGLADFAQLPEEPVIDKIFHKNGRDIPIYRLSRICGTCIAKNKTKSTVSLLTPTGVTTVKFRNEYFSLFDRQISAKGEDGIKHVVEKSWFNRGSMIVVTGMRRGDEFIPKKYASTQGHQLYKIDEVSPEGNILLRWERAQGEASDDE